MAKNSRSSKSNAPIIAGGIIVLAGITALTVYSSKVIVDNANKNADSVYADTYYGYLSGISNASDADNDVISDAVNSILQNGEYSSDDLIKVDGEWYVLSSLVEDMLSGLPVSTDADDVISVGGVNYIHIVSSVPVDVTDSDSEIPYYGAEYVVVDIDGNMVYLVKKGDTLSNVSGMVGYSIQELAKINSISNVNLIYEGQTLRIPASQEAIDYVKNHDVSSGDVQADDEDENVSDAVSDSVNISEENLDISGDSDIIGIVN